MYLLTDFCCICLKTQNNLRRIYGKDYDGITFYNKLVTCIPEMSFYEMDNQKLLCETCRSNLNVTYKFRRQCVNSKKTLLDYFSKLYWPFNPAKNVFGQIKITLSDFAKELELLDELEEIMSPQHFVDDSDSEETISTDDTTKIDIIKTEISEEFNDKHFVDIKIDIEENSDVIYEKEEDVSVKSEESEGLFSCDEENNESLLVPTQTDPFAEDDNFIPDLPELHQHLVLKSASEDRRPDTVFPSSSFSPEFMPLMDEKNKETGRNNIIPNKPEISLFYNCNLCSRRFPDPAQLTDHKQRIMKERPYTCCLCAKSFLCKDAIRVHLKAHRGEPELGCTVCAKRFYEGYALRKHMRAHTPAHLRPLQCRTCGKGFFFKSCFDKHMSVHSASQPHACGTCGVRFKRLSALRMHRRVRCAAGGREQTAAHAQ